MIGFPCFPSASFRRISNTCLGLGTVVSEYLSLGNVLADFTLKIGTSIPCVFYKMGVALSLPHFLYSLHPVFPHSSFNYLISCISFCVYSVFKEVRHSLCADENSRMQILSNETLRDVYLFIVDVLSSRIFDSSDHVLNSLKFLEWSGILEYCIFHFSRFLLDH